MAEPSSETVGRLMLRRSAGSQSAQDCVKALSLVGLESQCCTELQMRPCLLLDTRESYWGGDSQLEATDAWAVTPYKDCSSNKAD